MASPFTWALQQQIPQQSEQKDEQDTTQHQEGRAEEKDT